MSETATLLQTVGELANAVRKAVRFGKTNSLVEVTKLSRVEPLGLMSEDTVNLPYIKDIMQSALNIFTAYYMQAALTEGQVGGTKVKKVLDSINPDRDMDTFLNSFESYADTVQLDPSAYEFDLPRRNDSSRAVSFEANKGSRPAGGGWYQYDVDKGSTGGYGYGTKNSSPVDGKFDPGVRNPKDLRWDQLVEDGKRKQAADASNPGEVTDVGLVKDGLNKVLSEPTNLAVGKVLEIDFRIDNQHFKIPAVVRIAGTVINKRIMVSIMSKDGVDTSLSERFHSWRSGRIQFWRDLILAQDLIDAHRNALVKDESGVYEEIMARTRRGHLYGALSGRPSLATASNIYITTKAVADEVSRKLGGKMDSYRIRDKIFKNTYAMMIIVIDVDYERVVFYHRGINTGTSVSVRDIKGANKEKGPDITDVLKAYTMGNAPTF